jgi:bacteriocin biosynthesis cyclodehydratase domain-containing protein
MKFSYQYPRLVNSSSMLAWQQNLLIETGQSSSLFVDLLTDLLDGFRSFEEIYVKAIIEGFSIEDIYKALDWLENNGLLEENPQDNQGILGEKEKCLYQSQIRTWDYLSRLGKEKSKRNEIQVGLSVQIELKNSLVVVVGSGNSSLQLIRVLATIGIGYLIRIVDSDNNINFDLLRFQEELRYVNPFSEFIELEDLEGLSTIVNNKPVGILVYCPDSFDEKVCEWLNKSCLDFSLPFVTYKQDLLEINIGPLMIPHETACYVCYDCRKKALMGEDDRFSQNLEKSHISHLNFPMGVDLLAFEIVKFLTGLLTPIIQGRLYRLNILTGLMEVHPVLKLPRCPACGVHKVKPERKLWEE